MKNKWLERRNTINGFPADDEFSIQQGDRYCGANLDIYYAHQFVQNEKSSKNGFSKIKTAEELRKPTGRDYNPCFLYAYCLLEYTPVLKGSITGTIFGDGKRMGTFAVTEGGEFQIHGDKLEDIIPIVPSACIMEWITGEVLIAWDKHLAPKEFELIMDYEYNFER